MCSSDLDSCTEAFRPRGTTCRIAELSQQPPPVTAGHFRPTVEDGKRNATRCPINQAANRACRTRLSAMKQTTQTHVPTLIRRYNVGNVSVRLRTSFSRTKSSMIPHRTKFASFLIGLFCVLPFFANADEKPYGLDKRTPLTTSTVKGTPEPPSPFVAKRIFPNLTFEIGRASCRERV